MTDQDNKTGSYRRDSFWMFKAHVIISLLFANIHFTTKLTTIATAATTAKAELL